MLFSELNRINLNVLVQDTDYEVLPNLNQCYVHNKVDWTIWTKIKYPKRDNTIVDIFIDVDKDTEDGWEIREISSMPEQDSYLNNAFKDISDNLVVLSKKKNANTDYVKIYAGQFEADGTLNYNAFIENEDVFPCHVREPYRLYRGSWWTFNNGAFQWIGGGPKSIPECRFSYGPFSGPDPHHHDTNHEIRDNYFTLSKLPNLNFIFDEKHVLKGIVSLPCATEELKNSTKTFISGFLQFAWSKYHQMTFKNIDSILKDYSNINALIPTIRIAEKQKPRLACKPCMAVFELTRKPFIIKPDKYNYIFPDESNANTMLNSSVWSKYSVDTMYGVNPFPEVTEITGYVPPLEDDNTLGDAFKRLNEFTGSVYKIYNNFDRVTIYTVLNEGKLLDLKDSEFHSTALMTPSELFRSAKEIRKTIDSLPHTDDEYKMHVIVLPEKFCNKETLKLISNVRYVDE